MKKLVFLLNLALLLTASNCWAATTYYVRVAGGTTTQCTGTTNADYPGTGISQACAFNHPIWAIGTINTAGKMIGGDTLIVDDNSGTAKYMFGFGMPNTSGCTQGAPYDVPCQPKSLPGGPDSAHPTRVLGSAWNTGAATLPQFWGTESVGNETDGGILNIVNVNNVEIQAIEITDHSSCGFRTGANQCSTNYNGSSVGSWARGPGIYAKGSGNIVLKNVYIHGMATDGIHAGGINGFTMDHVRLYGNHTNGWNMDVGHNGTESSMTGTIRANYVLTRFSGCAEVYPASVSFTAVDYSDCTGQPDSGSSGDGWSSYNTAGTWILTNCEWSHSTQDGLDLLYGQGTLDLSIDKSLSEGNNGNQIKFNARTVNITNTVIIANCTYLTLANKWATGSTATSCRADGGPISSRPVLSSAWKFYNNTAYSSTGASGSPFIEIIDGLGTCNGGETYAFKNNILVSNNSATNWVPYYSSMSGACNTAWNAATTDHSDVYNFLSNPSGTGNVFTNPLFTNAVSASASSNLANITIQAGSPAKQIGASGITFWNTNTDYNNYPQNSPVDAGAIQRGSSAQIAQAGQACIATSDCASGTCSAFACTGSGTNNGGACATGATCTSGYCNGSLVCANPPTCGDGVLQAGESCDGSNLNGSNCTLQGFTGGSLTCASDCLSFVTSSCTNTTVFPLTPIIDTFTRANSTGLGANWGNLSGSMNISSNAALPITGASGTNKYYWLLSSFLADEEAYVTISNKGSNGDDLQVLVRFDPTSKKGYKIEPDIAGGQIYVYRQDPGEVLLGAAIAQAFSTGDSIGMSIVGSTITVYYKASGGSWVSKGTRTDTTYTAGGSIGLGSFTGAGATPDIKFTNFGGGSLNPITCGNSLKEPGEACDGTDLAGQSCITKGFASGTLSCATNCNSFVTTSCVTASVCGNSTKEVGEVCDGTDVNSQTCANLGYASGSVTCANDCLSFVTTSCVSATTSGILGGVIIK